MSNVNECLKTEQAINNQRLYGKNIISYKKQNILLLIFEFIIKQPMFYLGIIGTSIYIYLNKYIYALIFIIITILILTYSIYIVYTCEYKFQYIYP